MRRRERKWKSRTLVMLMALALCLTGILGWPGFGMTAQAGKTPVSSTFVFKVTVTGGKGVAVSDPEQTVDSRLFDTSFNCLSGQYVKLYHVPDPAPDFQKFDHWHVRVGLEVFDSKGSFSEEYFYEEDLTDFIVYPELQKFSEEQQEQQTVTPTETPDTEKDKEQEPEPEQKSKAPYVLGLILLLGICGVGGAFFFMKNKKQQTAVADSPDPDADYREDDDGYDIPEEAEDEEDYDESEDE